MNIYFNKAKQKIQKQTTIIIYLRNFEESDKHLNEF